MNERMGVPKEMLSNRILTYLSMSLFSVADHSANHLYRNPKNLLANYKFTCPESQDGIMG